MDQARAVAGTVRQPARTGAAQVGKGARPKSRARQTQAAQGTRCGVCQRQQRTPMKTGTHGHRTTVAGPPSASPGRRGLYIHIHSVLMQ